MKHIFEVRVLNLHTGEVYIRETKRCVDPFPTLARMLRETQWECVEWRIINLTCTTDEI